MAEATRQIQVRAVSSPIGGYRLNVINAQKVREGAIIARMARLGQLCRAFRRRRQRLGHNLAEGGL